MVMKKKIAIITSTRAEYGLLFPFVKLMQSCTEFDTQLIVTGTHLLEEYGNTVQYIYQDSVKIAYEIPIIDDNQNQACDIISKAMVEFNKVYIYEKYDGIIILGDRFELYGFAIPAIMNRIPIIHIHGGEKTEGALDEKIRHSLTKMASIHFASIDEYAKRITQMGENPAYVFSVGALGIDNIINLDLIEKNELEEELAISFDENVAVVTFHPVTVDNESEILSQVRAVFEALIKTDIISIVTMPNIDGGGNIIFDVIQEYITIYKENFIFRKSLGQKRYLSVLKYAKMVIGNSSSGIIEVPSFGIPTINIGDRQKGRFAPNTVIHCKCDESDIINAIEYGLSDKFQEYAKNCVNPYGDGKTAERIVKHLKEINFDDESLVKKEFFDIDF
jgi:UDP-hydrolysing UDP-N-acetyl-D-glucosamine 2-epimerase